MKSRDSCNDSIFEGKREFRNSKSYRYYWSGNLNIDSWPVGSGNLTSNPLFVSAGTNYNLQSNSPAIDAGDPATSPGIDYAGTIIPQGPRADIGAFEYVSGIPPDTIPPSSPTGLMIQ